MCQFERANLTMAQVIVTPEMKQAGAAILASSYDSLGDGVDELIAAEVFTAMLMKSDQRAAVLLEDAAS